MTDKSYNGWANWATWNVNLWIDSEEPMYRAKQRECRRFAGLIPNESGEIDATIVQQFVAEWMPDGTPDMEGPEELREVDWDEIAGAWREEAEDLDE